MGAQPHRIVVATCFAVMVFVAACSPGPPPPAVRTASTSSVVDTGLAEALAERFFDEIGVRMEINAVGSGQAFALGRRGEADLVLGHDPEALETFRGDGFVERVVAFARNDFVLAGPPHDPAGTAQAVSITEAFRAIADGGAPFVSRGDDSGTNARELLIWERAGVGHDGPWYVRTGQGMAETLRVADERSAYVLTDAATLATLTRRLDLEILLGRGPLRENLYDAVAVRFRDDTDEGALRFLDFLTLDRTRALVEDFGRDRYGRPLFRRP